MTLFSKLWLALLSLLSSLILWIVVRLEQQPMELVFEKIPVQVRSLPRGLTVIHPEEVTVNLKVEGPEEALNRVRKYDLQPYVDASAMGPGLKQVKQVLLDRIKSDERIGIKWSLQNVQVNVEKTSSKTLPVNIEEVDSLPFKDQNYDSSTLEPDSVTVYGPVSQVNRVKKARVTLNLSTVQKNQAVQLDVDLIDSNGNIVPDVNADPQKILTTPIIVPAPQAKSVYVQVNYSKEQPDFGYQIRKVEVTPSTVMASGSGAALARLSTIVTEPIDLSNIHQTTVLQARLRVPRDVRITKSSMVRVKIFVTKLPNSNASGVRREPDPTPVQTP